MLIFPLKKEWYEKIKSGEKTVEYREYKDYWNSRLYPVMYQLKHGEERSCYFMHGYNAETKLKVMITDIEIVDGRKTDLKVDVPVYAIHFKLEDKK